MISWAQATPFQSLSGGILIGLAVAILILVNGKIAGISGIVAGLLNPKTKDIAWRLLFIAGLILSPLVYSMLHALPEVDVTNNKAIIIGAGLLVGIGTRFGGGCTSGHGVCGIARLSRRSLLATILFMVSGALTVYITRHWLGVTL